MHEKMSKLSANNVPGSPYSLSVNVVFQVIGSWISGVIPEGGLFRLLTFDDAKL